MAWHKYQCQLHALEDYLKIYYWRYFFCSIRLNTHIQFVQIKNTRNKKMIKW